MRISSINNFKKETTSGKKLLEVAHDVNFNDFDFHIKIEPLSRKEGKILLTDGFKNGIGFVKYQANDSLMDFVLNALSHLQTNSVCIKLKVSVQSSKTKKVLNISTYSVFAIFFVR